MAQANKVYEMITDKILAQLDKGVIPWHKPWNSASGAHKNLVSGKPYRGINPFLLTITALSNGYASPYWVTYKQAKTKGGQVRKGECGTQVVFWNIKEKEVENDDGEKEVKKTFILRYYTVFNIEQCDGLEEPKVDGQEEVEVPEPIDVCEAIVANMPNAPVIQFGGNRACYIPAKDEIHNPKIEDFDGNAEFYSTLFHELGHSTGHHSRLNRFKVDEPLAAFGSESYSHEELTAEMTACFLCGVAGIENKTLDNSAAYIHGWSKKLKDQPKMVIQAAARAQKAADFILNQ